MNLVGERLPRVEDRKILMGRSRYVDDISLPGMLYLGFVRSSLPHARITGISVEEARRARGVALVLVGEDLKDLAGELVGLAHLPNLRLPAYTALATDKVRFVGDPVAAVVASSRELAADACELVEVEYEALPPVANDTEALDPGKPPIFDELGDNVIYRTATSFGDVEGEFAQADRVISETFTQHRVANAPMETRGVIAEYDAATDDLVIHASTQAPHGLRQALATVLSHPMDRLRVVNSDVGGSFGLKVSVFREELVVAAAAKILAKPVKWIETRTEHLLSSGHARDERITIQAAVRTDGTILALRVEMTMDQGAYPAFPFPAAIYTDMVGTLIPGPYRVRALSFAGTVVATNKCSYVAYRGPWEMETWVRERLIDIIARELNLDTVAVRRGNLVLGRDEDRMVTGLSLAKVSSRLSLERAVEVVDYQHLCADRDTARRSGRYLGIGLATYIEAAPGPPEYRQTGGIERATARLEPDGRLTIVTAQAPHGQGHETTLAQVAAEELGLPITHVRVVHGDTRFTPFKLVATGGSGAGPYTTGAVMKSTRALRAKILAVASHLLEIDPGDLVCTDGAAVARGVPSRRMSLADIARTAYLAPKTLPADLDASLEESHAYSLESVGSGWSGGTHICVVEVDIETGQVEIQRWVVIEDCGRMINPTIVEGQIRGAIAQGIGEVLFERVLYDDEAQLRSATFLDYLLPTAPDMPDIEIYHLETPPADELDFRGVGEGGAIVAPAALTNAIEDALAPIGVRINEQYLPPARLAKLAGVI